MHQQQVSLQLFEAVVGPLDPPHVACNRGCFNRECRIRVSENIKKASAHRLHRDQLWPQPSLLSLKAVDLYTEVRRLHKTGRTRSRRTGVLFEQMVEMLLGDGLMLNIIQSASEQVGLPSVGDITGLLFAKFAIVVGFLLCVDLPLDQRESLLDISLQSLWCRSHLKIVNL